MVGAAPGHPGAGPVDIRLLGQRFQGRSRLALQQRAAVLSRLTGRHRRVEGGVQTQTGDEGDRLGRELPVVEQIQSVRSGSPTGTSWR